MTEPHYKLCILDDDKHLLQVLARRLTAAGFAVTTIADACQPEQLISIAADIYLLDLRFGHQSGMHFIQPLRQALPHCRIVLMTGYASIATAVQAVKAGADDYLTKPVDFQVLRQTLLPVGAPMPQRSSPSAPQPYSASSHSASSHSTSSTSALVETCDGDSRATANSRQGISTPPPVMVSSTIISSVMTTTDNTARSASQTELSLTPGGAQTPSGSLEFDQNDANEELGRLMSAEQIEWEHIQRVLLAQDGNISQTARLLGMHRRTLQRKLLKHRPR
jgi:two-component system response regulator RegA